MKVVYIATMNVQVLRVISNDRFCGLVRWRHCCNKLTPCSNAIHSVNTVSQIQTWHALAVLVGCEQCTDQTRWQDTRPALHGQPGGRSTGRRSTVWMRCTIIRIRSTVDIRKTTFACGVGDNGLVGRHGVTLHWAAHSCPLSNMKLRRTF